jgi:membrane protein YqaA with SNARE-associated domain
VWDLSGYALLALSAFTSATLLPGSSEVVLAALWHQGYDPWRLWLVATCANCAGSVVNWWLGSQVGRFQHKPWFPASPEQIQRAQQWSYKFGPYAILLSWLPVIGDPLTVVAGILRYPLWQFMALVLLAKGTRYGVLLLAADTFLKGLV